MHAHMCHRVCVCICVYQYKLKELVFSFHRVLKIELGLSGLALAAAGAFTCWAFSLSLLQFSKINICFYLCLCACVCVVAPETRRCQSGHLEVELQAVVSLPIWAAGTEHRLSTGAAGALLNPSQLSITFHSRTAMLYPEDSKVSFHFLLFSFLPHSSFFLSLFPCFLSSSVLLHVHEWVYKSIYPQCKVETEDNLGCWSLLSALLETGCRVVFLV